MTALEDTDSKRDLYELEALGARMAKQSAIDRILLLYSALGFSVGFGALIYFAATFLPVSLSAAQRIALLTAGIGTTLGVMSVAVRMILQGRDREQLRQVKDSQAILEFLRAWSRFEIAGKRSLGHQGDATTKRQSPRVLIDRLRAEGKLDDADVLALENAFKMRNAVVHGNIP